MSVAAQCLINSQFAPNVITTMYTSPSNTNTIIDKFTALNSSGATATVSVYLVPRGGTAGPSNLLVKDLSLIANAPFDVSYLQNQILAIGDSIAVVASAANEIVIRVSGRQLF